MRRFGDLLPADLDDWFERDSPGTLLDSSLVASAELTTLGMRVLLGAAALLLMSSAWLLQEQRTMQSALLALPAKQRGGARELIEQIDAKVGAFIRGQAIVCAAVGSLYFAAFSLLGLPSALLLSVLAGVMEVAPVIGPVGAALPPLAVALGMDPPVVGWVLSAIVAIQLLNNSLIVPRVMDRSLGVNPLMTLLGMVAFGELFGLLGATLAIPLSAIVQLLADRFLLDTPVPPAARPAGREGVDRLYYQVQELLRDVRLLSRKTTAAGDDPLESERQESLENLAVDLEVLLQRRVTALPTEPVIADPSAAEPPAPQSRSELASVPGGTR